MGFSYFEGKLWSEITREERFFCQRLYQCIKDKSPKEFIHYLCSEYSLELLKEGEWEIGYEVCFYRDLWQHRGGKGKPLSPKRTFDLCLFGEKAIVIIEAKSAVGFDEEQTDSFLMDIDEVKKLTGIEQVMLIGLCSSIYQVDETILKKFSGPILTWKKLAEHYDGDQILSRADIIYKKQHAFSKFGRNSNIRLTGAELVDVFDGKAKWWVGRSGGIEGDFIKDDLITGRWCEQSYEVNIKQQNQPSPNYFSLEEFVRLVKGE